MSDPNSGWNLSQEGGRAGGALKLGHYLCLFSSRTKAKKYFNFIIIMIVVAIMLSLVLHNRQNRGQVAAFIFYFLPDALKILVTHSHRPAN